MEAGHLFKLERLQFGQLGGEDAEDVGCGSAADVDHGGGQDGYEGVLPGEGVENHRQGADARRQCAATSNRHCNGGRLISTHYW